MLISDEDHRLVKKSLEIPIILDDLEHNLNKMRDADLKLAPIFLLYFTKLQEDLIREIHENKRVMRQRGIKILSSIKSDDRIEAIYLCRGYQQPITLLNGKIQADSEEKLANMMGLDIREINR